jgi:carbon monoxide dehydrogenase subunit G
VRMTGEATVNAPASQIQAALRDPAVLSRAIPGCQDLAVTGPGTCRLTVTATVAATTGTYTGDAKLTSPDPDSLTVTATLAGAPGIIETTIHTKLTGTGDATKVSYDAGAKATGMIAAVGRRLLTSTAERLARRFFDSLNAELAPPEPGRSPAGAAAEPEPGGARAPAAAGRPGTAPAHTARTFGTGVLTGAALTLAGVILARRRTRP